MFILPTLKGLAGNSLSSNTFKNAALDLNFASSKSLTDVVSGQNLVTFTRASTGTYVGSDGVLRTAVTNLLLRSEEFGSTWFSSNITVSPDAIVAPNGTLTADKAIATTTNSTHQLFQITSGTSGVTYTVSFYVKAGEYNRFTFGPGNTAVGGDKVATINLSLSNPVVSQDAIFNSSAFATPVGNGWYRVGATFTATATGTMTVAVLQTIINNAGSASFAGDGTSGIYLWGAQLEQASTVGDYVPTTSVINSAPRFDHNPTTGESLGLLVEEARTNLLLRSEEFDNASWTKNTATITANATTAPNGTATADKLVETAVNNSHWVGVLSLGLTSNIYTVSVYAKAAERTELSIFIDTSVTRRTQYFNLSTGALGATSGGITSLMQNVGNGWYRCSIALNAAESLLNVVYTTSVSGSNSYLGDGTSGIFLWGAQIEAGAFPTSYIPTTTATVTRAADVASITGTAFSSFYNQTEGTVLEEVAVAANSFATYASIDNGTTTQNSTYLDNDSGNIRAVTFSSSTAVSVLVLGAVGTAGLFNKLSSTYKVNDFAAVRSGGTVQVDTSGAVPVSPTQLCLGRAPSGLAVTYISGTIKRLTYWPVRLANPTLQAITQP
jgi:hypothetical protein